MGTGQYTSTYSISIANQAAISWVVSIRYSICWQVWQMQAMSQITTLFHFARTELFQLPHLQSIEKAVRWWEGQYSGWYCFIYQLSSSQKQDIAALKPNYPLVYHQHIKSQSMPHQSTLLQWQKMHRLPAIVLLQSNSTHLHELSIRLLLLTHLHELQKGQLLLKSRSSRMDHWT